jgi:elongation factor Ts
MAVSAEMVKQLRERTSVSVSECKKALEEAGGDMEKAVAILKERSALSVQKKQDRALGAGTVAAYVHTTAQVGAMVLLSCETDFVSKNAEFVGLARDIAMHAAAMRPETTEALLKEAFIKDPSQTIADLVSSATQKFGERIEVSKFDIFSVQ